MSLLQVLITDSGLKVTHKINKQFIEIPFFIPNKELITAKVWSFKGKLQLVSTVADAWFTKMLSIKCRLVYMPDDTRRRVNFLYAHNKELTSLSDGYPILMISEESLNDLNDRLSDPVSMDRFRPNIVLKGGEPFIEDVMAEFAINGINFYGVKLCGRCVITTIDQGTAEKNKEPLKTLASYRKNKLNIYFGQNVLHKSLGEIAVGDEITILKTKRRRITV
jgi:uncharacterized protein YcbX